MTSAAGTAPVAPGARSPRGAGAGFTLMEVMLTVAITAAVFAMIGGILVSVLTASEKIDRKLRTEKTGYGILSVLRRDLTGVYAYALGGPAFRGEDRTVAGKPADTLRFVTTARVLGGDGRGARPALVAVGYRLEDAGEGRGLALYRRASAVEGDPLGGGAYAELCAGIEAFQLEYLDGNDRAWKTSWTDEERLPLAVKLALEVVVDENERRAAEQAQVELPTPKFEMVVGIPAQPAPPAAPTPAPTGQ